jgi:hypothetical protein
MTIASSEVPTSGEWIAYLAKYGIAALLVFATGVLLPLSLRFRRTPSPLRWTPIAVWLVMLTCAAWIIVNQIRHDTQRRFVLTGTTTGIEAPERLEFDDPDVFSRSGMFEGHSRLEWALITSEPIQGRPLALRVVDGRSNRDRACFEIQTENETLSLHYDPIARTMRDVKRNAPLATRCTEVKADAGGTR